MAEQRGRSISPAEYADQPPTILVDWKHPTLACRALFEGARSLMTSLISRHLQRRERKKLRPRSHDGERRVQKQANLEMETTMLSGNVEPANPGWGDPAPRNRGGTPEKVERRQAGTPATLVGNIDNAIDEIDDTGKRRLEQSYPVRLLKQRYGLSRNYAAFIAAQFRWGEV
jgi:hypothetical protein